MAQFLSRKRMLEQENVYEVERIVGVTKVQGRMLYRVRWLGYSAQCDTWEPYDNLLTCKDMIDEYLQRKQRKVAGIQHCTNKERRLSTGSSSGDDQAKASAATPPGDSDSNSCYRDFWKDLEDGKIDIFAEDMYSKVKGRSSAKGGGEIKQNMARSETLERKVQALQHTGIQPIKVEPKTESNIKVEAESPPPDDGEITESDETVKNGECSEETELIGEPRVVRTKLIKVGQQWHAGNSGTELTTASSAEDNGESDTNSSGDVATDGKCYPDDSIAEQAINRFGEKTYSNKENLHVGKPCSAPSFTNDGLRHAVKLGDVSTVRAALQAYSTLDLEQPNASGMTLLLIAAMAGYHAITDLLASRKANVNARHRNGATPLMLACDQGHTQTVASLIAHGAHLDIRQNSGETALMRASRRGFTDIACLLLNNGANFHAVSNNEMTAAKLAHMYRHTQLQQMLMRHIQRVASCLELEIRAMLDGVAHATNAVFPVQCLPASDSNSYTVHFQCQPQPGVGSLLFVGHALFSLNGIHCQLYGDCIVRKVLLNGVAQKPLTEQGSFVMTFNPLNSGRNELIIHVSDETPTQKYKLLVCAYHCKVERSMESSLGSSDEQ